MRRVHTGDAGHRVADEKECDPVPLNAVCHWGFACLIPDACDRCDSSECNRQEVADQKIAGVVHDCPTAFRPRQFNQPFSRPDFQRVAIAEVPLLRVVTRSKTLAGNGSSETEPWRTSNPVKMNSCSATRSGPAGLWLFCTALDTRSHRPQVGSLK